MAHRERQRAQRRKRKERAAQRREEHEPEVPGTDETVTDDPASLATRAESNGGGGESRSERKNREAREALEPLEQGERPTIVTVGAVLSALLSASIVIAYAAGAEVDGQKPNVFQVIAPAILTAVMAAGMWRARYWAVLGFQAVLLIAIVWTGLSLAVATEATQMIGNVAIMAAAGTMFWFMVKAMARIQMPERR